MCVTSPDIFVQEAKHNNLKAIDFSITPGELTVITGLSGSGKSTLLFDVLHAEGQRRYVETFSPYVRQFLDTLPRPKVKNIVNARPSIAVEQKNSIRNSRSTVGTMTDLCDYFKVWFSEVAQLHDPENGDLITSLNTSEILSELIRKYPKKIGFFCFKVPKPEQINHKDFLSFLKKSGFSRIFHDGNLSKVESIRNLPQSINEVFVIIDRIKIEKGQKKRLIEAIDLILEHGKGVGEIKSLEGKTMETIVRGLRSKVNHKLFKPAKPNLFSFNSPQGACPKCKGFGKTISIDRNRVIPDDSISLKKGAIKAFNGKIYGHCKEDLFIYCKEEGIDIDRPYRNLTQRQKDLIWYGEKEYEEESSMWYGVERFFSWVERKTYKMHVRVFLSKYRGYFVCSDCNGTRMRREAEFWKWKKFTLPELYSKTVGELLSILPKAKNNSRSKDSIALEGIRTRLGYLNEVGLSYLTLDRLSKTLSGGETQRVNLTTCLGSSLTDALFALDEPTIGLHPKDIGKLVEVLKKLADAGNCVCVVEHDEQVIRSADRVIEIGPKQGTSGGEIIFNGSVPELLKSKRSITAACLRKKIHSYSSQEEKDVSQLNGGLLKVRNATLHNLENFAVDLPLGKFVGIAGVSGSGKSTLINEIIFKTLSLDSESENVFSEKQFDDVILIDQNTISKTPRSNAILYADGWSPIKEALGRTEEAKKLGYFASDFSFNSGNGRCEECMGLGYEIVEMQFLSDIQTPCSYCNGMRFKNDVLEIKLNGMSVFEILSLTVDEAVNQFVQYPKTHKKLRLLQEVGLGYLSLGQPLNTLSGGESQRLKLVKFMGGLSLNKKHSILLIDEPSTGLHMKDVEVLVCALKSIVESGNSLFVIEHNPQILSNADWILELGPGAGKEGGRVTKNCSQDSYRIYNQGKINPRKKSYLKRTPKSSLKNNQGQRSIEVIGAAENNLCRINLKIPYNKFVVVTGPSGSGKSSLAFDVVFAEGQRRFMDSMSSYARQFMEQMPRPVVDQINGLPPTVSIQQRITRGSRKSTVGSITEITQYLRLLYAKIGTQLSIHTKKPLQKASLFEIQSNVRKQLKGMLKEVNSECILLSPLVNGRKGHHKPIVNWAFEKGFEEVRCDGVFYSTENFPGLDRYRIHDVEAVIVRWSKVPSVAQIKSFVQHALDIGNGRCLITNIENNEEIWHSTNRVDVQTGISYPELEPSYFSWNSAKGRCPCCKGYGRIFDWMKDDLPAKDDWWNIKDGDICPECDGQRIGEIARNVVLYNQTGNALSLPQILALTPDQLTNFLKQLKVEDFQKPIVESTIPEITERLKFMGNVGLSYLTLDRETSSLSGGEAQRIRLAGQLGSNLSGVLYVLDEPSIGLHPSDNRMLLGSLRNLQKKGNSLLVVEHDQETIDQADCLIEIGPEAGVNGGRLVSLKEGIHITDKSHSNASLNCKEFHHFFSNGVRMIPSGIKNLKSKNWLRLRRANYRNIKGVSVDIPIGLITVCCGVSGSGKSSLIRGIILKEVKKSIAERKTTIEGTKGVLKNGNIFGKVIEVDQHPIGKTSRSAPVTYLGAWDRIRTLFSQLPESKTRGYAASTFSFNVKGGRCEHCKGNGKIKLEMSFLPDSYVTCSYCKGSRFNPETLALKWNQKNISEILDLTMEEASRFFEFDHFLFNTFKLMTETGLGYLKLGQPSPSLSGGEAQRLKLASELVKSIDKSRLSNRPKSKPTLYILEEPTIGLHHKDRIKLFRLLRRLVDEGNTIIVIEHDVDLIANADYVVEMGPNGGVHGGKCIFQGTPEKLINSKISRTAPFIRKFKS